MCLVSNNCYFLRKIIDHMILKFVVIFLLFKRYFLSLYLIII